MSNSLTPTNATVPIETGSRLDWNGLYSKKFSYPQRKHLVDISHQGTEESRGRRHFYDLNRLEKDSKPAMKLFPEIKNKESDLAHLESISKSSLIRYQSHFDIKERLKHLYGMHGYSNQTTNTSQAQQGALSNKIMLKKARSSELLPPVNPSALQISNISSVGRLKLRASLSPDGSSNHITGTINSQHLDARSREDSSFDDNFKKERLMSLRNSENSANTIRLLIENNKFPMKVNKVSWKTREQLEILNEDRKSVRELDGWERNVLQTHLVKASNSATKINFEIAEEDSMPERRENRKNTKTEKKPKIVEIFDQIRLRKKKRMQTFEYVSERNLTKM